MPYRRGTDPSWAEGIVAEGEAPALPVSVFPARAGEATVALYDEDAAPAREPDREEIRAWARAQGLPVADRGQLKKVVLEAYAAAHEGLA
jgi:hypothetical protein